jgi:hypothetical protein
MSSSLVSDMNELGHSKRNDFVDPVNGLTTNENECPFLLEAFSVTPQATIATIVL